MNMPALDVNRLDRPALQAAVLYISIIMISLIAMVKPAQASGTVYPSSSTVTYDGNNYYGNTYCKNLASPDAAISCVLASLSNAFNSTSCPAYLGAPLSTTSNLYYYIYFYR